MTSHQLTTQRAHRDKYQKQNADPISFLNNRMVTDVVGIGGICGRVQGVGSDHWGTT